MKERLCYILGLSLLVLSLAYAIGTALQVIYIKNEWAECNRRLKEVGNTCVLHQDKYGQSVEFIKGGA